MTVSVLEFLGSLDPAAFAPVYLIGPGKAPRAKASTFEPFLAEKAAEAIVSAGVDPSLRDMALATYYADETDVRAIVNEARTMPFLTERRVVVVRNAERYQTENTGAAMVAYIDSPNDTTVLVLVADELDKRTKFYKTCEKRATIVECPALNSSDAVRWLNAEVKSLGRRIEQRAANDLVNRAGTRLSDVNNALTLVLNFIGEGDVPITEEAVRAACADVAEEEIWSLTDAIAGSQVGKALASLRALLDLGKHPDEIIGTINWLLKNAYLVATHGEDGGIGTFQAQKVRPLVAKFGKTDRLTKAFALCTDTQFAMRTTGVDGPLAVELLVVKLAHPGKSSA